MDPQGLKALEKAISDSKERKFKESVELAINLKDIDLKLPKNRIEEEVLLPKGRGKDIRIGVFGSGELAVKAKKVADTVIQPEEIDGFADNKREARKLVDGHTFFIAEAPMMPTIGKKLGVFLGPRGKMPRPVPPNADPVPLIKSLRQTVKLRSKESKTFHTMVGSKDMGVDDLATNIDAVVNRLMTKLERGEMNIASIYVKTTMGPSVRIK